MKLHKTLLLTGILSLSILATSGCGDKTPTAAGGGTTPITLTGITTTFATFAAPLAAGTTNATIGLWDMTVNGTTLYVCDKGGIIRTISNAGVAGTLPIVAGTIVAPEGITTDGTNLYVCDKTWHQVWQINIATNAVTQLSGGAAGTINAGLSGNVNANGTAARFTLPDGIAVVGGNLYICDSGNNAIRIYNIATTAVTTMGTPALTAPWDIATDGTNLYVTETAQIRKIPIANPGGATVVATGMARPDGITVDPTGTYLYVSETNSHVVTQVTIATGVKANVAGTLNTPGFVNGTGAAATFNFPDGVAIVGTSLYVADNSNNAIRKIQ